ncbi:LysO family transporter [Dethiothermospora halolimnae]|uniref:LysO family transporter n=1 Tax=Dethiothermospora halolimnae TaxID=3114390 RepID=UPI003CCC4048
MFFRIFLYLGILLLGFFISRKSLVSKKVINKIDKIQGIALLFLLFIMGFKIGSDEKVIKSFLSIGFKAIILSIFSIFFSVLLIKGVKRFIVSKEGKVKSNEH